MSEGLCKARWSILKEMTRKILTQPCDVTTRNENGLGAHDKSSLLEEVRGIRDNKRKKVGVGVGKKDVVDILPHRVGEPDFEWREYSCEGALRDDGGEGPTERQAAGAIHKRGGTRLEAEISRDHGWEGQRPKEVGNVKFHEIER